MTDREHGNRLTDIKTLALQCRDAATAVASLPTEAKNALLRAMADALLADEAVILAVNARDIEAAAAKDIGSAMLDRLRLDTARLQGIAAAVREVAELPDPVGQVTRAYDRPNGIHVERVRVPLGVIAMIYEARPNVTADAAALCLKAGNAVILRGGSEAIHSNTAVAASLKRALRDAGLPEAVLTLVGDLRRETILELIQLSDIIDLVIPRGGEGLIRFVAEHARVPVIKHYKGVCHIYVHSTDDVEGALAIITNAKVQRPGVCNAVETVLVDRAIADAFVPRLVAALAPKVELRGDEAVRALGGPTVHAATEDDWHAEYLDLILAVRVVDGLDAAIAHIERYGSDHTESILTTDPDVAERFLRDVNSSTVMVNASTRFADGGELGLGAEIGISTTRLHAYGPMGAEGLTTTKFVVRGHGQVRN